MQEVRQEADEERSGRSQRAPCAIAGRIASSALGEALSIVVATRTGKNGSRSAWTTSTGCAAVARFTGSKGKSPGRRVRPEAGASDDASDHARASGREAAASARASPDRLPFSQAPAKGTRGSRRPM